MKTNTAFNKIVIDTEKDKKSKFGLAHDVNTTASIGDTQPICCRLLVPKSKTTLSSRHIIRLAPMVSPAYGRLKAKYWNHFVGMSELLPRSFPALLSKTRIATGNANTFPSVPLDVPYMSIADISSMCLVGASFTVYFHDKISSEAADASYTRWKSYLFNDSATAVSDFKAFMQSKLSFGAGYGGFTGYNGALLDLSVFGTQFGGLEQVPINCNGATNIVQSTDRFLYPTNTGVNAWLNDAWNPVELSSADYVIRTSFTNGSNSYEVAFAVRLSAFGKRIRKILLGCGYQIDFGGSHSHVSVLPLFAYYKAYFDSFGLTLYDNWESSNASILLQSWDNQNNLSALTWTNAFFRGFVYDLGSTFVTEVQDYISAHQSSDAVNTDGFVSGSDAVKRRGFVNNIVLNMPSVNGSSSTNGVTGIAQIDPANTSPTVSSLTGHVFINRANHTQVDAELLKILYKWTNRETVAGKRIKELLIAGNYGDYVKECKSNFIGYEEEDVEVVDVNATADSTNVATGHNSVVGEYVGKGIAVTKGDSKSFSFENDEFGYWITIFAMVPESGFTQGLDLTLLDTDADHFYNRAFDGVGMEIQPKSVVVGGADWSQKSASTELVKAFGLVPRETKYKVAHNIANGDFSLRGVRDSYLPFTMDKWLEFGDRKAMLDSSSPMTYFVQSQMPLSSIMVAGNTWRYINRYQFLANFERIFTSFQSDIDSFRKYVIDMSNLVNFELYYQLYDHFICMNILDMVTYAPMLPISESYGTTDENDGYGDKTFTKA